MTHDDARKVAMFPRRHDKMPAESETAGLERTVHDVITLLPGVDAVSRSHLLAWLAHATRLARRRQGVSAIACFSERIGPECKSDPRFNDVVDDRFF